MGQTLVKALRKYWLLVSVSVLSFLFLLTIAFSVYQNRASRNQLISRDIANLAQLLEQVDKDAGIINFEHTKNYIDFLNVIDFVSSEVGPVNLRNPKGWKGPYIQDNPTMQEKYYLVVNHSGKYYVTPGDGVKLTNGKYTGKDVLVDTAEGLQELQAEGLVAPLNFAPAKQPINS